MNWFACLGIDVKELVFNFGNVCIVSATLEDPLRWATVSKLDVMSLAVGCFSLSVNWTHLFTSSKHQIWIEGLSNDDLNILVVVLRVIAVEVGVLFQLLNSLAITVS